MDNGGSKHFNKNTNIHSDKSAKSNLSFSSSWLWWIGLHREGPRHCQIETGASECPHTELDVMKF